MIYLIAFFFCQNSLKLVFLRHFFSDNIYFGCIFIQPNFFQNLLIIGSKIYLLPYPYPDQCINFCFYKIFLHFFWLHWKTENFSSNLKLFLFWDHWSKVLFWDNEECMVLFEFDFGWLFSFTIPNELSNFLILIKIYYFQCFIWYYISLPQIWLMVFHFFYSKAQNDISFFRFPILIRLDGGFYKNSWISKIFLKFF